MDGWRFHKQRQQQQLLFPIAPPNTLLLKHTSVFARISLDTYTCISAASFHCLFGRYNQIAFQKAILIILSATVY